MFDLELVLGFSLAAAGDDDDAAGGREVGRPRGNGELLQHQLVVSFAKARVMQVQTHNNKW